MAYRRIKSSFKVSRRIARQLGKCLIHRAINWFAIKSGNFSHVATIQKACISRRNFCIQIIFHTYNTSPCKKPGLMTKEFSPQIDDRDHGQKPFCPSAPYWSHTLDPKKAVFRRKNCFCAPWVVLKWRWDLFGGVGVYTLGQAQKTKIQTVRSQDLGPSPLNSARKMGNFKYKQGYIRTQAEKR